MLDYIRFIIDTQRDESPRNWLRNVIMWASEVKPSDVRGYQTGDFLNW